MSIVCAWVTGCVRGSHRDRGGGVGGGGDAGSVVLVGVVLVKEMLGAG